MVRAMPQARTPLADGANTEGLRTGVSLSGTALLIYLAPSIFLASFGASPGFVIIISVLFVAYASVSVLALLSLLTLSRMRTAPRGKNLIRWVPFLIAAGLPAIMVVMLGDWRSSAWYFAYGLFLPSGLLVASHVAPLTKSVAWLAKGSFRLPLAYSALIGSAGSPVVARLLVPIGGWEAPYYFAIALVTVAVGCDFALAALASTSIRR